MFNYKGRFTKMKKINKKGFTLVELLAVTIILIIVILIAFNAVDDISKKSKKQSIKANASSFYKELDGFVQISKSDGNALSSGQFSLDQLYENGFKINGTKPNRGYVIIENYKVSCGCLEYKKYKVEKTENGYSDAIKGACDLNTSSCKISVGDKSKVLEFGYSGSYQQVNISKTGTYHIELWGAQGGSTSDAPGGKGAYTSGDIQLNKDQVLYFYVGSQGNSKDSTSPTGSISGGYNGGGNGNLSRTNCSQQATSGGGATDVRLVAGDWDNAESLNSRIMVAAGGGGSFQEYCSGSDNSKVTGGFGGTLVGGTGSYIGSYNGYSSYNPKGATQTTGGESLNDWNSTSYTTTYIGTFGKGATGANSYGGGGGGYWGGASGNWQPGSGGSSFISGYKGSVAIASDDDTTPRLDSSNEQCANGTTDVLCSRHYSNYVFADPYMVSGNSSMPGHDKARSIIGNEGNGYAKITYIADPNYDD